jgi:hypothetical protein
MTKLVINPISTGAQQFSNLLYFIRTNMRTWRKTERRTNEQGAKSNESKRSITPKNILVCNTTKDERNFPVITIIMFYSRFLSILTLLIKSRVKSAYVSTGGLQVDVENVGLKL